MNLPAPLYQRLLFLMRVSQKEIQHLHYSSNKVFSQALSLKLVEDLEQNPAFAESLEAYTSRFCRLQDTLGDKLLPAWLESLGEPRSSVIDNLDKANKLGIDVDADEWLAIRQLRNKMIHEYIESSEVFLDALGVAHDFEKQLYKLHSSIIEDLNKRGLDG